MIRRTEQQVRQLNMTLRGRVHGGVIVPEEGAALEEGVEVMIETIEPAAQVLPSEPTLAQRLLKYAGAAEGLPSDMARNHDHYIHGTPRK
jgi:hypothetical protein